MEFQPEISSESTANILNAIQVSVVIPFFKNKNWLVEAIQSVYSQSFVGYEIIVIDDGSEEDISDLETVYPNIKFKKIQNSGPGTARNIGIAMALGKYVAFLDSDDLWIPSKLKVQVDFMNSNNLVWSHSNYIKFWDETNNNTEVNAKMEGNIIPNMFIACPIATPCVMIQREALVQYPALRFSEETRIGEDSYFWFKIAEKFPLGHIDQYLTKVRLRGSNAAYQAFLQLKSRANHYEFIKKSKKYYNSPIYFQLVKFGFLMCYVNYAILTGLTRKLSLNENNRELISKFFYFFPYIYLKALLIIYKDSICNSQTKHFS